MTISSFQFYNITQLYNRISKLKTSRLSDRDMETERKDIVSISSEARKKQLLEQTKKEVLDKIKNIESVKR